ncbi:MAG: redoxin domain-containing protein [Pyrinomonadaceae bacterium]|nr:redoxin domain-containing protein [Pyrinomonadaceae bacterium]MBP9109403.1 redoxin domain-containing protein [Pyrinomonadaceae bacterium]
MKFFLAVVVCLLAFSSTFGQNEQAPIIEKNITYKDWTYKDIRTGAETNLRQLTAGKKLVIVVYYAPWCPNWRFDAPMLIRLYNKHKGNGLEIVAVGEYDPLPSLKNNLDFLKIPFPAVYESDERAAKQKTLHYEYRRTTGDARGWGSPWYIFLDTAKMEKKGDVLVNRTHIINGEMIEAEGEKFIREKLGLPAIDAKAGVGKNGEIEVCEPDKKIGALIKP